MNKLLALITLCVALFNVGHTQSLKKWEKLPFSLNRNPWTLFVDPVENVLYSGGEFDQIDGKPANFLRYKDGVAEAMHDVPMYRTGTMIRYKGRLYVGGYKFLRWEEDTRSWTILDSSNKSKSGSVMALQIYKGKLLVGGDFRVIAGHDIAYLAQFDGENWSSFPGVDTVVDSYIKAMAVYKGNLYIAGNMTPPAAKPENRIHEMAMYDGRVWTNVAGGVQGDMLSNVHDLKVWRNELYVAGQFSERSNSPGNGIARWNGIRWSRLGDGLDYFGYEGVATSMIDFHDNLYVTGYCSRVGDVPASYFAKWDGERWCAMGNFDNATSTMAVYNDELYVAGGFTSVDGDSSIRYITKWVGGNRVDTCSSIKDDRSPTDGLILYPNPTSDRLFLNLADVKDLIVVGMDGRLHIKRDGSDISNGLDVSQLASGVYIIKVNAGKQLFVERFIKL